MYRLIVLLLASFMSSLQIRSIFQILLVAFRIVITFKFGLINEYNNIYYRQYYWILKANSIFC
jgi:hypothetical protein